MIVFSIRQLKTSLWLTLTELRAVLNEAVPNDSAPPTHVDQRLLELDVQTVVGHGDDGILRLLHKLGRLTVQLHKGHLATHEQSHDQDAAGRRCAAGSRE